MSVVMSCHQINEYWLIGWCFQWFQLHWVDFKCSSLTLLQCRLLSWQLHLFWPHQCRPTVTLQITTNSNSKSCPFFTQRVLKTRKLTCFSLLGKTECVLQLFLFGHCRQVLVWVKHATWFLIHWLHGKLQGLSQQPLLVSFFKQNNASSCQ